MRRARDLRAGFAVAALLLAGCESGASGGASGDAGPSSPAPADPGASSVPDPTGCREIPTGVTELDLVGGGVEHAVRIYVPSTFAGARLPTVLNWHGYGSTGAEQAIATGYETLAEAEGFLVVHATGAPLPGDTRNAWQLERLPGDARDDVAFAGELIDHVVAGWCADPGRIYSTGMSNGGFFTARLVCELADRLAAAVSVAGLYHPDDCAPSRAVPYLGFHGTDDAIVPFDGGGRSLLFPGEVDPRLRTFFEQVMPEEFAEFADDAGCDPEPTVTTVGDEVIRSDYTGCDGATPMAFFEITGGGHTWPNWPIAAQVRGVLGHTTDDVDATVDGWEFLSRHTTG